MYPFSAGKESKTQRKRRKRRELANKAAEEELAEISLEQQVQLLVLWSTNYLILLFYDNCDHKKMLAASVRYVIFSLVLLSHQQ